jgi:Uma2 family endonuclease
VITAVKKKHTYEDYHNLPEGAPYQLIHGELIMTPAPATYHQRISKRLEWELLKLEEKGLGEVLYAPVDVYFSETETYQPDLIFITKERLDIIGEEKVEGAPDLIMEILSPSTAYYDLKPKFHVYEQSGVKEYWIVDPTEKSIEIFGNKEGSFHLLEKAVLKKGRDNNICSRLFSLLKIDLGKIFG